MSLIAMPWSIKLIYGIIIDTVPLFGSKRKNYLILFSFLQFVTHQLLFFEVGGLNTDIIVAILLICSMSIAWCDVTIDAMMVKESRNDIVKGS
jgi:hypothetical protein